MTFLPTGPRPARTLAARPLVAALLAAGALSAAACTETLDGGAACPALCPQQRADELRDTVLAGVLLDSALAGFPLPGETAARLLQVAPAPDSLDVRLVVRFDSLPARFFPTAGGDSLPIARVDSSFLRLRLDTLGTRAATRDGGGAAPLTVELFDVDTVAAVDTVQAALNARFRPDRRLGSVTFAAGTPAADSLSVPVDPDAIVRAAGGSRRLRVGVRLTSPGRAALRVRSGLGSVAVNATTAPRLVFRAVESATAGRTLTVLPASTTPASAPVALSVVEQTLVAASPRRAADADLVIGGLPAYRGFVRFDIPRRLSDSTQLVRATLELTQRPAAGFAATDSVVLVPQAVYATGAVTDLVRLAGFSSRAVVVSGVFAALDTVKLSPIGSGRVELPLVGLVRSWRQLAAGVQRAVVVRALAEGAQATEVRFFSSEGPAEFRPRLRLTYLPASPTAGLP